MRTYTYLAAHVEDRTRRATGETPGTGMLAERNEQPINFYPIGTRQNFCEHGRCLFRSRRVHVPPTIRDTVDVDIDGDARLIASNAEHEVSALQTNSAKGEERCRLAGQNAIMLSDDAMSDLVDLLCFRFMKSADANAFSNIRDCRATHSERGTGQGK